MKISRWLVTVGIAGVCYLGGGKVLSQSGPPGPGFGGGNFDPAQIQKFIMDGYREQLEIKDDAEWKVIEGRIQKVLDARREVGFGGAGMMGGMFRRGGGQNGGQAGGGRRGFGAFFPPPGPEETALQKAVDSKVPNAELKAALSKFVEMRRRKQADLEKAQAELRTVLSLRQEAVATLSGLL
jgi:hypothetical protein